MEPPPMDASITEFIMNIIIIIFGIICISIGRWFGKPRGGYTPIPDDRFKTGYRNNEEPAEPTPPGLVFRAIS